MWREEQALWDVMSPFYQDKKKKTKVSEAATGGVL